MTAAARINPDPLAALRLKLRRAGYFPIPCEGKAPPLKGWQDSFATNADEISLWSKSWHLARNTGVLCKYTPALDIDLLDEDACEAIETLANQILEDGRFLIRIGKAPKRLIPLRTEAPFKKLVLAVTAPNGAKGKIEFLGDGQQFIVDGVHPETKSNYCWHGADHLADVAARDLPLIRDAKHAQEVLDKIGAMLVADHSYTLDQTAKPEPREGGDPGPRADWAALARRIIEGRDIHDAMVQLSASHAACGIPAEASARTLRSLLLASALPRDERFQERLDDIERTVRTGYAKFATPTQDEGQTSTPLPYINMSNWDNEPVPDQDWTVANRIPRRQVALFTGEGAAGKSTVELHRSAAHVLGREWLGTLPEQGPALFIDVEDDKKVIHRRLAAITKHFGVTFADLIKGGLHLISLVGQDAVLATASRSGKIEPTPLYKQILEAVGDIKPITIGIASSANVYAGSEIDRSQVQQFISLLARLAILANGDVTLIAHPSLTGIANDTGLSGNTAWHNAVRARFYLKGVKPADGEEPDGDLREIVFKKNNYGPVSEKIVLRYADGLFLPVPGVNSLDRAARDAQVEDVFLALLQRFTREGRNTSDAKGPTYGPALFAQETEAKEAGLKTDDLAGAMRRLFEKDSIHREPYRKDSKDRWRLAVGSKPKGPGS
jgi:RecA-family ATPase